MTTITTILTTYNRSFLLQRAISSVRAQTWKDIKIIIRDDCSTDDTESVAKRNASSDTKIIYKKSSEKLGAHENIRQGIKDVQTDYFSFLCDDDYLEPNFYKEGIRLFNKYPDASFVAFRVDHVDINGKYISSNMENCNENLEYKYYSSDNGMQKYLKGLLPGNLTGIIFKKKIAETIDYGDFSEVGYGADILFVWRASSRYNFVVTNFKAGNYTSHSNSTSSKMVKYFDERFIYWWRNRILTIKNDPDVSELNKKFIMKLYMKHPTKSLSGIKYYTHGAIILILERVKKRQFDELRIDFINMNSFISLPILLIIKLIIVILVNLKLDEKIRIIIRKMRN